MFSNTKSSARRIVSLAVLSAAMWAAGAAEAGITLYVDDDAPPGGDGLTWDTAFRHLQDALAAAQPGSDVEEIHVGQGIYRPDLDEAGNVTPGDQTETFQLISRVSLLGGYAGYGAGNPDDRNIDTYITTLSGDLAGDDEPEYVNYEENSWHVVTGSGTDETALIEGFTITAGYASGPQYPESYDACGAGMFNDVGSPTVRDCTFAWNRSLDGGAGLLNLFYSSPKVTDCLFDHNWAGVSSDYGHGGGIFNGIDSQPQISGCTFRDNVASSKGGGMWNYSLDQLVVTDCTFENNIANESGGGLMFWSCAGVSVVGCTFENNSSPWGAGFGCYGSTDITVAACTFAGNNAVYGGGMAVEGADPTIINCLFVGNEAAVYGGGLHTWTGGNPTLINCTFSNNTAATGGGVYNHDANGVVMANCILWANSGEEIEGAPALVTYSDVQGGYPGTGNIDEDPEFVDPDNGDYHLQSPTSPCIDAGDNDPVPEGIETDLDGNPRFAKDQCTENTGHGNPPIVDIGAYEFQPPCPCDFDCDGDVDTGDLLTLLAAWGECPVYCPWDFNGDGVVDELDEDILWEHWGDCPEPPEECPWDLNGDGVVDFADLTELQEHFGPCPLDECPTDVDGDGDTDTADLLALLAAWGECP